MYLLFLIHTVYKYPQSQFVFVSLQCYLISSRNLPTDAEVDVDEETEGGGKLCKHIH